MDEKTKNQTETRVARLTLEFENGAFRSKIEGEIPTIPLIGVLMHMATSLSMQQSATDAQRQLTEAAIVQAKMKSQGGVLFPDGTPFKGN